MTCPITCQGNSESKNKVDDHRCEGEKKVEAGVLKFSVFEFEKWDDAFQHPEKNKTTSNDKCACQRRNVLKVFNYGVHVIKG